MSITRGPWEAVKDGANFYRVALVGHEDETQIAEVLSGEEDAKAIAALPELIKRLRLFIESCECFRAEYGRYPLFFDSDVEKSKTLLRRIGVDFSEEVESL